MIVLLIIVFAAILPLLVTTVGSTTLNGGRTLCAGVPKEANTKKFQQHMRIKRHWLALVPFVLYEREN